MDVRVEGPAEAIAYMDAPQERQALLNLAMNAVETSASDFRGLLASPERGRGGAHRPANGNGPISESVVLSIFELFFMTDLSGTGLGLAIAHNIARPHAGFLQLTMNTPETVRCTLTLPKAGLSQATEKA